MRNDNNYLLKDFSSILASVLPILQLFFTRLPDTITAIFLQPQFFTPISIVTLVVSYTLIIGYQSTAYLSITLPFQGKRTARYQDYLAKVNIASSVNGFVKGEQLTAPAANAVAAFVKKLEKTKPTKQPLRITQENIITICVIIILVSSLSFVALGQGGNHNTALAIAQSVSYILLIAFSALVLAVYRRNDQANKRNEDNQKNRTSRAIQLAISSNCFGDLPQVKFISCFDEQTLPSNYHVWVEYKDQKYEIITDYNAVKVVAVYPFGE